MKLFILLLLLSPIIGFTQNFEGEITYSNSFKSKMPKLKDEQLNSMMGTIQEYYIKGNNYKSLLNGKFVKMQLYRGEENKSYTLTAKSDTLLWEDYGNNKDVAVSFEIQKNKVVIMNIPCDLIVVNTAKSKTYYYYNRKYSVDPKLFSKHNYGNWYYIISKTKALPIKIVYETGEYIFSSTAISITSKKLSDTLFNISDKNKIAVATW